MVLGVEENRFADSSLSTQEDFLVPEFGRVSLSWLDLNKKYRGAIFRLQAEAAKQISEIVGFTANFDFPGIRTAIVDLRKTEGYILFEIERNTKPTDLAVRYSRERWNLLDASGRSGDTLRPWIKTEYQAKYISEKVVGWVAEQLRISPENAGNFIIRVNLKERIFGLLCEEAYSEQMPTGAFSPFSLPSDAMLALAREYGMLKTEKPETKSSKEELAEEQERPSIIAPPQEALAELHRERTETGNLEPGKEEGAELEDDAEFIESPGKSESVESEAVEPISKAAPEEQNEFKSANLKIDKAEPETMPKMEPPSKALIRPGQEEPVPQRETGQAEHGASESMAAKIETAKQAEAPPGSTRSLEKFIVRKEDRAPERPAQRREPEVESSQAKYATYSRSEVDHMLKQQTENITSALGSKISSQQRVFQEAVEKQEKSFAKLSDSFVLQFDQSRQRLENMSKESQKAIETELEGFKRDLGKELEQHRAQINKAVVPVAKFIEEKNTKPAEKAQKEVHSNKAAAQNSGDLYSLKPLLIVNLIMVLSVLAALFAVVMPGLSKIEELQIQVQNLKQGLQQPSRSGAAASSGNLGGGSPGGAVSSDGSN